MKASVILVVAGLAAAKSAGTTMRSTGQVEQTPANELNFLEPGGQYVSIKCSEIAHEITQGQQYLGLTCGDNVLTVIAGRENSPDVAMGFEHGIDATQMFSTADACCAGSPKELNFYVEVNMTFTVGSTDVGTHTLRIGQGHYGGWGPGGNNWWVGGTHCQNSLTGINCINKDGQKLFLGWNAQNDQVEIQAGWSSRHV